MTEGIIIVASVGLIGIFVIMAFAHLHNTIIRAFLMLINYIGDISLMLTRQMIVVSRKRKAVINMASKSNVDPVVKAIRDEGKKTRKETQELKTRLTQVRKDLNVLQKVITSKKFKAVVNLLAKGADE